MCGCIWARGRAEHECLNNELCNGAGGEYSAKGWEFDRKIGSRLGINFSECVANVYSWGFLSGCSLEKIFN